MASEWPWTKLGDVVINFDSQRVPLSAREREKRRGRFPYYGATGVMDHVDDYLFEGMHLLVAEDGSVETDRGAPFLQLVDGRFWVNNHAHVIKGETDKDTRYLFYALSTIQIRPFMTGSVQAKLSQGNLNRIAIPYPSRSEQHAIADILGTLDDKIELNRQMNQTLEAMAQALFKSWFVDFEPFRDQGMQDSPLGEIPVGWRVGKVNDIAVLHRESINPTDSPSEVFDHYSIPAFDEGQMPKAETGDQIRSNKFRIPYEAVLISKLNPRFLRVWLPFDNGSRRSICSTEFFVVTPIGNIAREYFYSLFSSHSFLETFSTLVTGTSSSHQRVRPEDLMAIDAIVPPEQVTTSFSATVRPLLTLANRNLVQNITISTIRDTLLPKLLSGEIRVKDAEKFVEEAV